MKIREAITLVSIALVGLVAGTALVLQVQPDRLSGAVTHSGGGATQGGSLVCDGTTCEIDSARDGTADAVWTTVSTDGFTLSGDSGNGDLSINASVGAVLDWSNTSTLTLDGSKAQLAATDTGDDVALIADDVVTIDAGGGGADYTFSAALFTSTQAISITDTESSGTITLVAGTGTATTFSGATCVCSDETAVAAVQCSVSGTTLTANGTGTDVIAYSCL